MNTAVIFSIPTAAANGYCWRWRAADGKAASKKQFAFYYDCLMDAQANGFVVRPERAHGANAPAQGALPVSVRA